MVKDHSDSDSRQDNTYHSLCYTSRGALAGMRNISMGPPPPLSFSSFSHSLYLMIFPSPLSLSLHTLLHSLFFFSLSLPLSLPPSPSYTFPHYYCTIYCYYFQADKHHPALIKLLCDELKIKPDQIVDFDLCLADTQPAVCTPQFFISPCSSLEMLTYSGRKEGNVLFNNTLNTFYLRLYGVIHMVKDHSDSEKGNTLPPHGLLFLISSKGSFIPRSLLHQSWSTGWNEK